MRVTPRVTHPIIFMQNVRGRWCWADSNNPFYLVTENNLAMCLLSDIKVDTKQKCVDAICNLKKVDIHLHLNVYGDEIVDVSTVRWGYCISTTKYVTSDIQGHAVQSLTAEIKNGSIKRIQTENLTSMKRKLLPLLEMTLTKT